MPAHDAHRRRDPAALQGFRSPGCGLPSQQPPPPPHANACLPGAPAPAPPLSRTLAGAAFVIAAILLPSADPVRATAGTAGTAAPPGHDTFQPPPGSATPLADEETTAEIPAQTRWIVHRGTLKFTIRQLGREITGEFREWSAEIAYRPAPPMHDRAGLVKARINIPSLDIGPFTQQALGPDFFDAENHPTALFEADILPLIDGQEARGTLTLKGQTHPVIMPFWLSIDGNNARMQGEVTLDRLDFGIGSNLPDEDILGVEVRVGISLLARSDAGNTGENGNSGRNGMAEEPEGRSGTGHPAGSSGTVPGAE